MRALLEGVTVLRDEALAAAATTFAALSFEQCGARTWRGPLTATNGLQFSIEVTLPAEFPDKLPTIRLADEIKELLAHVDRVGTICIAPSTGLLIDTERPEAVIHDALDRARAVLSLSKADRDRDILREVASYWVDAVASVFSLCRPDRPSGSVNAVEVDMKLNPLLIADSIEIVTQWTKNCGWTFRRPREAYFLRLNAALMPPPYREVLTLANLKQRLADLVAPADLNGFEEFLRRTGVFATVIFSVPLGSEVRRAILGAQVDPPLGKALREAEKGFRPGKAPASLLLSRSPDVSVSRLSVDRLDEDYLLPRGGVEIDLRSKRVVVIGCGAVGSHVAHSLAQCGIGTIRLIDSEDLESGNVHRHFLGARFIGNSKVGGLRTRLNEDFPLLHAVPRTASIENLLRDDPDFVLDNDVVVCALGEETIERRINAILRDKVPRVHAWVEPYGIAGHVLVTGFPNSSGCYACLFDRNDDGALFNAANVTKSGQDVQRTLDGCAGTFTPYGVMDAQIAANRAAKAVVKILSGFQNQCVLWSWIGEKDEFLAQGLELSRRAAQLEDGRVTANTYFACEWCEVCHA